MTEPAKLLLIPALMEQAGWVRKREWQGLTYKERNDCLVEADPCEALLDHEAHELMRTVEAKLKEKNT
jgi:hypothetical protein